MPTGPVLPTLRAAVFAAVCLGLGAGAHTLMTHAPIPVWAFGLGAVAAFVPARAAAARGERGFAAVLQFMGGLQVVLHLLFWYAQQVQAASTPGSMPGMAGRSVCGPLEMSGGMLLGTRSLRWPAPGGCGAAKPPCTRSPGAPSGASACSSGSWWRG